MKLVGITGSNAEQSYNRDLLIFIKNHYQSLFDLKLLEIKNVPLFNQDHDQTQSPAIQSLVQAIDQADGVIIATPEHNYTIPAALKSTLEWLSFKVHPLENKPVMIIGASYLDQGTSRAQLHLRQILDAPGVNAYVLPGNEFLLGKVKEAFDTEGQIKDEKTVDYLDSCLTKFMKYVHVISKIDEGDIIDVNLRQPETKPNDNPVSSAEALATDITAGASQNSDSNNNTDTTASASQQP